MTLTYVRNRMNSWFWTADSLLLTDVFDLFEGLCVVTCVPASVLPLLQGSRGGDEGSLYYALPHPGYQVVSPSPLLAL